MKILPSILLFVSLFQCHYATAQGDSFKEFISGDFTKTLPQDNGLRDSLLEWQERIAIQLDKKAVMPKDLLFFKAYVLTGPKQLRVSASDVLKVELLDGKGKLIKSQNHKILSGQTHGSFEIPKKLKQGTYFFRAYTQWMLNYGAEQIALQKIQVGDFDRSSTVDKIQFYPEGGALVAGLENKLIIRIDGNRIGNVQIVDVQDQSVSNVVRYGENIFSVLFKPEKENRYFLKFNNGLKYPLPPIQDSGYTLQVNTIEEDVFDLRILASPKFQNEILHVIGESKGIRYLHAEVDFKDDSSIDFQIPKKGLPLGLFELSLRNEGSEVLAKRKLQIGESQLRIALEPIDKELSKGIKSFAIKVTDREGKPVAAELSVSFKGHENTLEPFDGEALSGYSGMSRKERFTNDLLLRTHQLPVNSGTNSTEDFPDKIYHDFQNGLEFYGQAYDLNNKLIANTAVQILIKAEEGNIVKEVRTDSNGMLKLSGLQLEGAATMVFRRVAEDTKSKLIRVHTYTYEIPPLKVPSNENNISALNLRKSRPEVLKTPEKKRASLAQEEGVIMLDGVTLVEEKARKMSAQSVYGIEPTRQVYQDLENPRTIPQLFLGIPGFQVSGMGGLNPTLVIPKSVGIGPVLWVVDGFPLDQETSSLREVMNLLSYIDIERIDFLSGPSAAIYGSRASGGVISINTRSGDTEEYYARKDGQTIFQGFHNSVDFTAYQESRKVNKRREKLPQTLYWNPSLKTDENGEAIIKVKLPSEALKIKFEALILTPEGRRGRVVQSF